MNVAVSQCVNTFEQQVHLDDFVSALSFYESLLIIKYSKWYSI